MANVITFLHVLFLFMTLYFCHSTLAELGEARFGVWGMRIQKANTLCFWRMKLSELEKMSEEVAACHQESPHRLWNGKGVDVCPGSAT